MNAILNNSRLIALSVTFCSSSQNCILADEMGLGKTIQALAFVREVQKFGIVVSCGPSCCI